MKMAQVAFELGLVLPEGLREFDTALFIDATHKRICRPQDGTQWFVYSKYKRHHSIKFQAVTGPDGIIYDLWGAELGRRGDNFLLHRSRINQRLANLQLGRATQLKLYADKLYGRHSHLNPAYKNYRLHPFALGRRRINSVMSRLRIGIEWDFKKVTEGFRFVDYHKGLKIRLSKIGLIYRAAVLLMNAHTCLYSSQTGSAFDCLSPRLSEYFDCPECLF